MSPAEIMELYLKERDYQSKIFGDYKTDKSLSFPSFIIFLQTYIKEIELYYTKKWQTDLPEWMLNCAEYRNHKVAPVKAYEQLIKVMALAGAALEAYAEIDPEKWRQNPHQDGEKWKNKVKEK
ncbi:MAG: hypothetical protein ACTSWJ_11000 [Candidatus Heimdallarchaeaceae archaeon]